MHYKHTCDTIFTHFQGITNNIYGFGRPFFAPSFFTRPPYFNLCIFIFTHTNDGWTGLYIKLCHCYSNLARVLSTFTITSWGFVGWGFVPAPGRHNQSIVIHVTPQSSGRFLPPFYLIPQCPHSCVLGLRARVVQTHLASASQPNSRWTT